MSGSNLPTQESLVTPEEHCAPNLDSMKTPADLRAGGPIIDEWQDKGTRIRQEAELVARLEAVKRMFLTLVDRSVGTNVIEAEMMGMVKEKLVGPTGHRILQKDQDRVNQRMTENEFDSQNETDDRECWRDLKLVKTLTKMRLKTVKGQLGKARTALADTLRHVTTTCTKDKARESWDLVKSVKSEVWKSENSRLQRKVEHLTTKSSQCSRHNKCRDLDKIWKEKMDSINKDDKESMMKHDSENKDNTSEEDVKTETCVKYKDRPQDLNTLETDRLNVEERTDVYNRCWSKPEEQVNEVVIYGDVDLSEDEISLLNMGPGFMVVTKLDKQEMMIEANVTMTKIRWAQSKDGWTENLEEENENLPQPMTEEEESLAEKLEEAARDVIADDGRSMDLGRKRPTDQKNNRMVHMPPPGSPLCEATANTRMRTWQRTFENYRMKICKDDGTQVQSNLSVGQQLALNTLSKKIACLEVLVMESDKGNNFVVMDEITYLSMADDHTASDIVTTPEDVKHSQRVLSTTAKSLGNIFGVGQRQSHKGYMRCMDNLGSAAEDVPKMRLLPKTHKKLSTKGHPQSRPVVSASTGMSSRAGDMIADVLEPMISLQLPRLEDKSTEEVLSQLEETEKYLVENGHTDIMVGSLDVKALYPSLDIKQSAMIVEQFILNSKVEVNGINTRAAQVYLASNLSESEIKEEGLQKLIPQRTKKKGMRPGPTTQELRDKAPNPDKPTTTPQPSKWKATTSAGNKLTDRDTRILFAKVIKVAMRTVFHHHMYQFAGVTYRQARGGPIGLRLTSLVARLVMDHWASLYLTKMTDSGVKVHMFAKYVDDVNVVNEMLQLGSRWRNDGVEWSEEWRQEDVRLQMSREAVTMGVLREAADSILEWLEFTSDLPENYESGKVPMLDLEVWVQHPLENEEGLEADLLVWKFFEKPVMTKKVIRSSTAFTWRNTIVTLSMEVFRRLRNTSRQLTSTARAAILCTFVDKMRNSGFTQGTTKGVLKSGIEHYYRKLKQDLSGGPRLNSRDETNVVQKRRTKLSAGSNWFSRRRGGQKEHHLKENGWRFQEKKQERTRSCQNWTQKKQKTSWSRQGPQQPKQGPMVPGMSTTRRPDCHKTVATLLVPYTVGSTLKDVIQEAEDSLQEIVGEEDRVRVVEQGGDLLSNLLGRTDPWATKRTCGDTSCWTCQSTTWISDQIKSAKKTGSKPPKDLVKPGTGDCRREGNTYSIQCATCLTDGVKSLYQGESSLSGRQRHGQHRSDLDNGVASSPLVHHAIEVHGGIKPHYLAVIGTLEPKPLQRAVREACNIARQPAGACNLNRCMEWGCPRVPVLNVTGGDKMREETQVCHSLSHRPQTVPNPRPDWSMKMLQILKEGRTKRVRLTDQEDATTLTDGEVQPEDIQSRRCARQNKKPRTDQHPIEVVKTPKLETTTTELKSPQQENSSPPTPPTHTQIPNQPQVVSPNNTDNPTQHTASEEATKSNHSHNNIHNIPTPTSPQPIPQQQHTPSTVPHTTLPPPPLAKIL